MLCLVSIHSISSFSFFVFSSMMRPSQISSLDLILLLYLFFFNDTATTEIYTLSLHDALPISSDTVDAGISPHHVPHQVWGSQTFRHYRSPRSSIRFVPKRPRRMYASTSLHEADEIGRAHV